MVSYAQAEVIEGEFEVEEKKTTGLESYLEAGNIVDKLPNNCGTTIIDDMDTAKGTMKKWLKAYKKALKLAKLQPREEHKTFPFEGASTAMAPFIMEAMIDFNARSAPELAYSDKIIKVKVYGGRQLPEVPPPPPPINPQELQQMPPEQQQRMAQLAEQAQELYEFKQAEFTEAQERIDTEKEERAERVSEYSNYQISKEIPNWKREQDKLLLALPCVGTMYKETFYDVSLRGVNSRLCYGDEIIFDQNYPTFEAAPDNYRSLPQMTRNEVIEKIRGEEQWDMKESELSDDESETYDFIAAWTWLDTDDDMLQEPYYVVVWKQDSKAVYARPRFDEDTITYNGSEVAKIEAVRTFTQFQFIPDPEGSPMGLGWGILLGKMFEEINLTIRQQLDAGTLQVLASNSGLIASDTTSGRGNSVQRGPIEIAMGKLTPVEVRGGNLAQNVVQFPAAGPSAALFQLTEYMVESTRRMTDASSQAEANPNEAAALYLARLQQTLKRPNIIIMRVYDCAAKEFELIFELNHKHFSDEKYNEVIDDVTTRSMRDDFNPDDCDIALVADPSQGSDMERIARAEAVLQNAKTEVSPITDLKQATRDYYEVLGVKDVLLLVPEPQGPDPMQAMLERQQQMDAARQAAEAEFKNRELRIKEAKLQLDKQEQMLKAMKEAKSLGIELDVSESEITKNYALAFKALAEAGSTSVKEDAQGIEDDFISQ